HLVRSDKKLSGTYTYVSVGRDLTLAGEMGEKGEFSLRESVDGKETGEFKGTLANDGSLAGTWSSLNGEKKLPFQFTESSEAPAPTAVKAGATKNGKPVEAALKDDWADFLVKLAKSNGAPVSREDASKDYAGFSTASEFSP